MRTIYLYVAASALTLTACKEAARDDAATSNTPVLADTVNAGEPAAPASEGDAETFVATIAASDMFEIESGKLASANAASAKLKAFGDMLVKEHTKSSADLKTAAGEAIPSLTPPTALTADLQTKLDALKAAKGEAFDTLFKSQQIEGHENALATLQAYASTGDQASLTGFATKATRVVQQHLNELKGM